MNKYRNDNIDKFMEQLENDLTAIVGQEFGNLDVKGVLERNRKNNPEMSIEKATILAMRDKAAVIMRKTIALATSLDRITAMAEQMTGVLEVAGHTQASIYNKRLEVLTDIPSIVNELS